MKSVLSALDREEKLKKASTKKYQLLVIGGGITGAGIALDASSRGISTALVEMNDFSWGTSSRSTKLIHGGLRYLKQLEVSLVREVGLERAIVHKNARHLVVPEKMLLPIVKGGGLNKWTSSLGLYVYDYLAAVPNDERRIMLDAKQTAIQEPLLRTDNLKGGGLYFEYRTDDARLTISAIKKACELGADAFNHTKVTDFIYKNGKVCGVKVTDMLKNEHYELHADYIVNAAGPWVDSLREIGKEKIGRKKLHLTKGVHLVVPKERLPLRQSVYFDKLDDGRMLFAIPRNEITYIGTTDTSYRGDISEPSVNEGDITYVLEAANAVFPKVNLQKDDVISSWAGLRPLIHEEGKSPSELSRKDEFFPSDTGLISIAGGKLTGYRMMAKRTVDKVVKLFDKEQHLKFGDCKTEDIKLSGANFNSFDEVEEFIQEKIKQHTFSLELTEIEIRELVYRYGTDANFIFEKALASLHYVLDADERIAIAELWYSVHFEMACTINDYFIRRTGRLYFDIKSIKNLYPIVEEAMDSWLDWDVFLAVDSEKKLLEKAIS